MMPTHFDVATETLLRLGFSHALNKGSIMSVVFILFQNLNCIDC